MFNAFLLYFAATNILVASHWSQFRGPTGDGHAAESNLPVRWSENDNIAWKIAVHGLGHSSPVVWGNQIWLTTADQNDKQLKLYATCFDIRSGKTVHNLTVFKDVEPQNIHKMSSHACPTPVVEGNRIYVHYGSYGTACLDTASGKIIWSRQDFVVDHRHGPSSSPIMVDDLLVLQFDGMDRQFMVAIDKYTGATVWRKRRDIAYNSDNGERKKAFCTPLLVKHNGTQQLVTTAARAAISYNPRNGDEIWRVRFIGDSATARPVASGKLVFLTTSCVDAKLLAVDLASRGDATETGMIWRVTRGVPQRPSPLYIDGMLYGIHDSGVLTCRDARTGKRIWKKRLGGNYSASPIFAGGHVYLPSENGLTFVVATGRKYKEVARNKLEDGCIASPAVAGGSLFLRTRDYLYCIRDDQKARE